MCFRTIHDADLYEVLKICIRRVHGFNTVCSEVKCHEVQCIQGSVAYCSIVHRSANCKFQCVIGEEQSVVFPAT